MIDPTPKLSQHQRDLILMGLCPFCEAAIKGWKVPSIDCWFHLWADYWEKFGIDSMTGHKKDCKYKKVII